VKGRPPGLVVDQDGEPVSIRAPVKGRLLGVITASQHHKFQSAPL